MINDDATLLNALMAMTEIYHQEVTREYILSGLPVDPLDPKLFDPDPKHGRSLFTRAASKAGFDSTLEKKPLRKIAHELLPVILLMGDDRACLLLEFDRDMEYAHILIPGQIEEDGWIAVDALEEEYTGRFFLMKKRFNFDIEAKLEQMRKETESKHWFWSTLARTKRIYIDIVVGSFLINLFVLALPLYLRNIYDRVIPNSAMDTLWVLTAGILSIFVLEAALKLIRSYFMEIAAKKSDVVMTSIIFEKVLDMKLSEQTESLGKFTNDLKQYENLRNFLTSGVITTLVDMPFAILFLGVVYWVAGDIVFIPLTTIGLVVLYALVMKDRIRKSIRESNHAAAVKSAVVFESLNAIETMKAFNYNNVMQWKLEEAAGNIAQKGLKSRVLNTSISTVTAFLVRVQTVAVIVTSVYMIYKGELTTGGLLVAYILSSRAVAPVGKLVSLILQYNKAKTGFKTIDRIMKIPVEHPEEKAFVSAKNITGKIEFSDVDFAYPDANQNALKDVSFRIEAGEHVAIMGEMGSGKTTIINLLMGFYAPKQGLILIDDVEIDQYAPAELRQQIAYVPQEVVLIQGTVKENIAIKHPGIDSHKIVEAAKISGAIHYINRDPEGFSMKIKERGQNISGGQRQSIGIARAFLEDFTIALMDEPTSHLDDESEQVAIEGIRKKIENKTALIVTHKNSMLSLVDRLIWMKNGKIVHDGPKEEVLRALRRQRSEP